MDAETPPELARPQLTPADVRSIFIGIMLAMFLSALDSTIVATAMPTIGRELGDIAHLPWIVTAYLLAATAVTPLYGKFADMHGRRITMLSAILIFIAGSVASALAPSMLVLALGRGLQGLGGGGLIALAQTIIADLVTPRERGRYQAYFGTVFATASVLGPVLGGFLSETFHWSWIFWINVPLGLVTLWLVGSKLKLLPRHDRRHRLDVLGAVLMVSATSTLMLAVSGTAQGGSVTGIGPLGLLAASGLFWVAFGARLATAREPLIPISVLRNRIVAAGTATGSLAMGVYVGLTIIVPIFFEASLGLSARQSGLGLIPMMIGVPIGATVSGRVMAAVRHYKRMPMAGLAVTVAATAAFAASAGRAPFWLIETLLAVMALGLGTVFPITTVAVQNAVDPHHLGTATANMNFTRQLVGALVVAVFGAITLGASGFSAETLASRGAADTSSFTLVFWLAAAGFGAALVALVSMEERPLRDRRLAASEPVGE